MNLPHLQPDLETTSYLNVLESQRLAQLGDFLVNYIYTAMRTGVLGIDGSIHVWDRALAGAVKDSGLRPYFRNRTLDDKLADGLEALVAYAFLHEVISLEEMIQVLSEHVTSDDVRSNKREVSACRTAFTQLTQLLMQRVELT